MLIELLNSLLLIDDASLIEEMLLGLLSTLKLPSNMQNVASNQLHRQQQQLSEYLHHSSVPPQLADEITYYQHYQQLSCVQFQQQRTEFCQKLVDIHSPFAAQARQCLQLNPQITPSLQTLIMSHWRTSLVMQANALTQEILDEQRQRLLEQLQRQVKFTHDLLPLLAENDNAAGKLWDMSTGQRSMEDYQLIMQYGEFLAQQPELLQLAQQLGRSRRRQPQPDPSEKTIPASMLIREPGSVPEQIDGLQQSDDILRLVPAEQASFVISELEDQFYRRMLEKTLLNYRLCGDHWRRKLQPQPTSPQIQQPQQTGAFLVCVDTSGSMGGFNERCAKAFCLALTRIALAEQRACFILLFSTDVICYTTTADQTVEQLLRFLSQRFRGGTDLTRCLTVACDKIQQDGWQQADVVVISDFISQRLPESLVQQIRQLQQPLPVSFQPHLPQLPSQPDFLQPDFFHQHRFHAVATSRHGKPAIMRIFDHIWHFDTSLRGRVSRQWRRSSDNNSEISL